MAKKKTFEDKMADYEAVVEKLEDPQTRLEDVVKHYLSGRSLEKELREQLAGFEAKIEELSAQDDGLSEGDDQ